jgi:hypothetical protein
VGSGTLKPPITTVQRTPSIHLLRSVPELAEEATNRSIPALSTRLVASHKKLLDFHGYSAVKMKSKLSNFC